MNLKPQNNKREEKVARKQVYHCDGYYHPSVCPNRGIQDAADIRYDKEGFIRRPRLVCKSNGIQKLDGVGICHHCSEHKHIFRRPSRVLTGAIIYVTPYHVKLNFNNATIAAYRTREELVSHLRSHPEDPTYGEYIMDGSVVLST